MATKVISLTQYFDVSESPLAFNRNYPLCTSCDTSVMKSFDEEYEDDQQNIAKWAFNLNYKEIESMLIDSDSIELVHK